MTAPEEYTRQQAADPSTPQQVLADIAALRPDLRPAVALNPSAYPGLLDWLGTLGEPGVDTALGQRRDREAAALGGMTAPDVRGTTSPGAPDGSAPWTAPEVVTPVGASPATMPLPAGGPFAAPAGGGPVPPQGYHGGGFPGAGGPGMPYEGFGGGQPGRPGVGPGGYPPGSASGSGSRRTLWIVLGVVGAFLVAGVVVVLVVVGLARGVAADLQEGGLGTLPGETYGDNPELDALWDACAAGDMVACDDLYGSSRIGTEYERFGDTCGGQTDGGAYCAGSDPGSDAGSDAGPAPGVDPGATGTAYGDDPVLDALWDACAAEDLQACDDLYFDSPSGSEYETFGDTCGGRTDGGSLCSSSSAAAETYGDDPALDALWDACGSGDLAACDELYFSSGIGTEYEEFGETCGRTRDGSGLCAP
jgi:hypothetical protein